MLCPPKRAEATGMEALFELVAEPVGAACILAFAMLLALLMMLSGDAYLRGAAFVTASVMVGWIGFFVPTETSFAVMLGLVVILCLGLLLLARRRRAPAAAFSFADDVDLARGEGARLANIEQAAYKH